jgi:hypothetical protein
MLNWYDNYYFYLVTCLNWMINTTGHHTLRKTAESVGERRKLGPVLARTHDEEGRPLEKQPFAGEGVLFLGR